MSEDVSIERVRATGEPYYGYQWLFQVNGVDAGGVENLETLSLRCQSASLPGTNYGTAERPWMNHTVVYPNKPEKHGTLPVTFYMYNDLSARTLMENWNQAIVGPRSGVGLSFDEIFGTITLKLLNANPRGGGDQAENIGRAELYMAWPQEVGEPDLSDDNTDTIATFDVTFQYSNHEFFGGEGAVGAVGGSGLGSAGPGTGLFG